MEPNHDRFDIDEDAATHGSDVAVEPFEHGYLVVIRRTTGIRFEYFCQTEREARQLAGSAKVHES